MLPPENSVMDEFYQHISSPLTKILSTVVIWDQPLNCYRFLEQVDLMWLLWLLKKREYMHIYIESICTHIHSLWILLIKRKSRIQLSNNKYTLLFIVNSTQLIDSHTLLSLILPNSCIHSQSTVVRVVLTWMLVYIFTSIHHWDGREMRKMIWTSFVH